jgi:hypothetical protein
MVHLLSGVLAQDNATRISSVPSWYIYQPNRTQVCNAAHLLRRSDEHTQAQRMAIHIIRHSNL